VPDGLAVFHAHLLTSEQILAGRHVGPAFVQREPALLDRVSEAGAELAALAASVNRNGALIFSMWMRPSWTGSMPAARVTKRDRRVREQVTTRRSISE
jgi:hypothetical protein